MQESIARFSEQFEWLPAIENKERLSDYDNVLVCGMGGSHLGGWLLQAYGDAPIAIHRNYGLPRHIPPGTLVLLSSYSGNTEEVLDAGREALKRGLPIAAAASGGELLAFARENMLPYVELPTTTIPSRMTIGYSMLAIAHLLGYQALEEHVRSLGKRVDPLEGAAEGERLAEALSGKMPIIWASSENFPLAYIWKIKLNETAKMYATCNAFPELCHNELEGFEITAPSGAVVVFLNDASDHPRIQARMKIMQDLLQEKGAPIEVVTLHGSGFEKAFRASLLADWTATHLAKANHIDPLKTPLIDDFKQRMLNA